MYIKKSFLTNWRNLVSNNDYLPPEPPSSQIALLTEQALQAASNSDARIASPDTIMTYEGREIYNDADELFCDSTGSGADCAHCYEPIEYPYPGEKITKDFMNQVLQAVEDLQNRPTCFACHFTCLGTCDAECLKLCGNISCNTSCWRDCQSNCSYGCSWRSDHAGNCFASCKQWCYGCSGDCYGQCTRSCGGNCQTLCDNTCTASCSTACFSTCTEGCQKSCSSTSGRSYWPRAIWFMGCSTNCSRDCGGTANCGSPAI